MTIKGRDDIKVIHVHGQIFVAMYTVQPRKIVVKHHRHLKTMLLVIG